MPEVKWKLSFDTCKLWVGICEEEETKNGNVHRKGQVACKQEDACVLGDGWWSKQIKIKISRFGNKLNRKIPSPGNFWHHLSPTTLANALLVTREAWQVSACKQSNQKTWGPATTAEPSCDVNQVHIWRNSTKRERVKRSRSLQSTTKKLIQCKNICCGNSSRVLTTSSCWSPGRRDELTSIAEGNARTASRPAAIWRASCRVRTKDAGWGPLWNWGPRVRR
jgi:hypothetical protein